MISLYDYQQKAKNEVQELFATGTKKVMLQMPTGAGKTRTFCSIISDRFQKDAQFRCIVMG